MEIKKSFNIIVLIVLVASFKNANCQANKKQINNGNKKFNSKNMDSFNNVYEKSTAFYHEIPVGVQANNQNNLDESCHLNIACNGNSFSIK
jgi:hypothetical protein